MYIIYVVHLKVWFLPRLVTTNNLYWILSPGIVHTMYIHILDHGVFIDNTCINYWIVYSLETILFYITNFQSILWTLSPCLVYFNVSGVLSFLLCRLWSFAQSIAPYLVAEVYISIIYSWNSDAFNIHLCM